MNIVDLPLRMLVPASWNSNSMSAAMLDRLATSIRSYDLLVPLIVRLIGTMVYEVLSGNQRLTVVEGLGFTTAPCIIVALDDAHARLLAQAINSLRGVDDLGMRAEVLRTVLEHIPEGDVLAVLPESAESLRQLASVGQQDMADYLRASEQVRAARLHHFSAQLTSEQSAFVDSVLHTFREQVRAGDDGNPNVSGLALYRLCQAYIDLRGAS